MGALLNHPTLTKYQKCIHILREIRHYQQRHAQVKYFKDLCLNLLCILCMKASVKRGLPISRFVSSLSDCACSYFSNMISCQFGLKTYFQDMSFMDFHLCGETRFQQPPSLLLTTCIGIRMGLSQLSTCIFAGLL
jgi:hypothetical protein